MITIFARHIYRASGWWLDTRSGFRHEDLRNLSKSNPVMMEMLEELKEQNLKLDPKNEK